MNQDKTRQISTFGSRVTSIISVTLVLLLLGIVALTAISARSLTDEVRRNLGFIVKMERPCSESLINDMKLRLAGAPYVDAYVYSSAEDVIAAESEYLGEDLSTLLDANPFSAEFDVRLRPAYACPDSIDILAAEYGSAPGVEEVLTESAVIRGVDSTLRRVGAVLLTIAGALLIISLVLINNTVSLSVYARRFIIHTMKLVGATTGFIRRPFIRAGAVNGLIAGLVASVLLLPLRSYAQSLDPAIGQSLTWGCTAAVCAAMTVLGILICSLAAIVATNKYLRANYDDMFLK